MPVPAEQSEKGALMQTLRICVRSPGAGAALAPADGVPGPAGWRTPEQEGPPALPHPPGPPCAGGSRASAAAAGCSTFVVLPGCPDLRPSMGAAVLWFSLPSQARRSGAATSARAAGSWGRPAVAASSPAARLAVTGPCAATREPGPAGSRACAEPEDRSPLGQSPAMLKQAGEPAEGEPRPQRQGGRVLASSRLLRAAPPPLTPRPRQQRTQLACEAPLGGGALALLSEGSAPLPALPARARASALQGR